MKLLLAVVLSMFVFVRFVEASTEQLDKAVMAALHLGELKSAPVVHRKDLANALLQYWQNFNSRIPRNSPSEAEWLKQELSSNELERGTRAINSVAYGLDQLTYIAENCEAITKQLSKTVGTNQAQELYLWLKFTQCYSDEIFRDLELAKLSNGRADGDFKMQSFGLLFQAITGKVANSLINE